MSTATSNISTRGQTTDRWTDACVASAFVALVLICAHVAYPSTLSLQLPYAGGAAAILGIGAVVCTLLKSRGPRIAAASVLLGLMLLRSLTAFLPHLFQTSHGSVSFLDAAALTLQILAAAFMLIMATGRVTATPSQHA
jgi:hypothetical protein